MKTNTKNSTKSRSEEMATETRKSKVNASIKYPKKGGTHHFILTRSEVEELLNSKNHAWIIEGRTFKPRGTKSRKFVVTNWGIRE